MRAHADVELRAALAVAQLRRRKEPSFTSVVRTSSTSLSHSLPGCAPSAKAACIFWLTMSLIQVNRIINAINGCTTKPNNVAALQEILTDLENKLWVGSKLPSPIHF
jgi:hypothetical protein